MSLRALLGRTGIALPLTLLLIAVLATAPLWISLPPRVKAAVVDALATRLEAEARLAAELARPALQHADAAALAEATERAAAAAGLRLVVRDVAGEVLAAGGQSGPGGDPAPVRAAVPVSAGGRVVAVEGPEGQQTLRVAVAVAEGPAILATMEASLGLAAAEQARSGVETAVLLAFAVAAVVAQLLGVRLARRVVRPLRALTLAADQVAGGEYGYDVALKGTSEVEQLGAAFERMAGALQRTFRAVEAERDRLDAVLRNMADGILIADAAGVVTLANPAAGRILGVEPARAIGRRLAVVVREHEIIAAAQRCLAEDEPRRDHTATVERASPRRYLRAVATRVGEGRSAQILLVLQDLTEVRRLEVVRRDLLANVSHELRTPLAAIKAMVETLEDGALEDPPAARDFLARVHRETDGLSHLVEELLQLSRIESGQDRLQVAAVTPAELAAATTERLAPLAERAGVTLLTLVPPDVPAVLADRERIAQVLVNLVHNALKFTPPGGKVTVSARRGEGEAVFSVADTGVGIAEDDLPRLFERFYKADKARASGGTGLGLAIAKHLVQAHGGRIWAESAGPGQGATFSFCLPLAPAEPAGHAGSVDQA